MSEVTDRPDAQPAASGWAAWQEWVERELGAYRDKRAVAVDAAAKALDQGLSPNAAVVAARVSVGAPVPPDEIRLLWDELQTLERVAVELGTVRPTGDLTEAGLAQISRLFQARLRALREIYKAVAGSPPAAANRVAQPAVPKPPSPSVWELFADNSILTISIAGAFLLIVATLLFEVYGSIGLGGPVRFTGVLILNLVFGAAGYLCLGRPRLRPVGQTYLAIFALMVPLTVFAAWTFLSLEGRGISRELALVIGGLGCSILYAVLGVRLGSRGYAALSMVALPAGWRGILESAHAGTWTGAWLM